jgi:hypothetical protein
MMSSDPSADAVGVQANALGVFAADVRRLRVLRVWSRPPDRDRATRTECERTEEKSLDGHLCFAYSSPCRVDRPGARRSRGRPTSTTASGRKCPATGSQRRHGRRASSGRSPHDGRIDAAWSGRALGAQCLERNGKSVRTAGVGKCLCARPANACAGDECKCVRVGSSGKSVRNGANRCAPREPRDACGLREVQIGAHRPFRHRDRSGESSASERWRSHLPGAAQQLSDGGLETHVEIETEVEM